MQNSWRITLSLVAILILAACTESVETALLEVTVKADASALSVPFKAGEQIHYDIQVANTGNVALNSLSLESTFNPALALSQTTQLNFDSATMGSPEGQLQVNEVASYTATYSLTTEDIRAGMVAFQITAQALSPQGETIADVSDNGEDEDGNAEDDATLVRLPALPALEPDSWNQFKPAGDTVCSDGSEYSYFVYPGKTNKLVVEFIGGGACWNYETCVADPIYNQNIDLDDYLGRSGVGIYDHGDARNPFRDWFHVVIPYCTGDIHWGDASTSYINPDNQEVSTIQHKGAVNSRAVLDWVYSAFEAPNDIFVTGCSAGAYGSAMWAPHINQHYRQSKLYQLGDSGAGIVSQDFVDNGISQWNPESAFPSFIPALDPSQNDIFTVSSFQNIYKESANFFPNSTFSQYNTNGDTIQIGFYGLMKGESFPSNETIFEWAAAMPASLEAIAAETTNFNYFIDDFDDNPDFPGTSHCIINKAGFYETAVADTTFVGWLEAMISDNDLENINVSNP